MWPSVEALLCLAMTDLILGEEQLTQLAVAAVSLRVGDRHGFMRDVMSLLHQLGRAPSDGDVTAAIAATIDILYRS